MGQHGAFGALALLIAATFVDLVAITSPTYHVKRYEADNGKFIRVRRVYESRKCRHQFGIGNEILTTENSTIITAQVGGTAILPCSVRKFNSGVVSWIRKEDYQLLTVGLTTYSSDDRFFVEHARHLQNWDLQIRFVTENDAGIYECQVSTHPPTSIFIKLKVIEAIAEIAGAPDLFIKSGSTLRIVCSMKQNTELPTYVFWYHNDRMINYDKERVTVLNEKSVSVLQIENADETDSGNYSCVPSNAKQANVNVHVLNGEKPAAMQHGGRNNGSLPSSRFVFLCWCCLLHVMLPISIKNLQQKQVHSIECMNTLSEKTILHKRLYFRTLRICS